MDLIKLLPQWLIQVLLVFIAYTSIVESLYFHIQEGERKCFIEEIPDDTLVVGELIAAILLFSAI